MIGLYFVIGALVLLATLLLFGFVGCGFAPRDACTPSPTEDYPGEVKATDGLVAYWRLGEPDTTPVPSSGGAAKDDLGQFNGDYFKLAPAPPDESTHSPAAAGAIILGVTRGLLQVVPQDESPCILTDGGYVQVPWHEALNPPQFTFEAWISPNLNLDSKYFYCLVESTGPQGLGPKKTGWGLYLGPSDINNPDPAGPLFWQVWMGDGNQFNRVAIAKPDFPKNSEGDVIPQLQLTYLALSFDGVERLRLFLYFPDNKQHILNLTADEMQALDTPTSPIIFYRNDPSTDGQGDFFIGTGSNLTLNPSSQRLYPFKGKIQEVAFYNRDLTDQICELETLINHELSGGFF